MGCLSQAVLWVFLTQPLEVCVSIYMYMRLYVYLCVCMCAHT